MYWLMHVHQRFSPKKGFAPDLRDVSEILGLEEMHQDSTKLNIIEKSCCNEGVVGTGRR